MGRVALVLKPACMALSAGYHAPRTFELLALCTTEMPLTDGASLFGVQHRPGIDLGKKRLTMLCF